MMLTTLQLWIIFSASKSGVYESGAMCGFRTCIALSLAAWYAMVFMRETEFCCLHFVMGEIRIRGKGGSDEHSVVRNAFY